MTLVCRPTPFVRFIHTSEQSSEQLMYRMARVLNTVLFFPMALRRGTRRNAIWLKTCKRTGVRFFLSGEKRKHLFCLRAARLSSPRMYAGGFCRDLVKPG